MTDPRSENDVPVVLVLAAAENGVIGRGDALPWDLPDDLQHFKRTTLGHPIIMGRKTFDSVGFALPGRRNLVITRDPAWRHDGVLVCHSLDEALERAFEQALIDGAEAVMVVGGAEIYRLALPRADKIWLTRVHGEVVRETSRLISIASVVGGRSPRDDLRQVTVTAMTLRLPSCSHR